MAPGSNYDVDVLSELVNPTPKQQSKPKQL